MKRKKGGEQRGLYYFLPKKIGKIFLVSHFQILVSCMKASRNNTYNKSPQQVEVLFPPKITLSVEAFLIPSQSISPHFHRKHSND